MTEYTTLAGELPTFFDPAQTIFSGESFTTVIEADPVWQIPYRTHLNCKDVPKAIDENTFLGSIAITIVAMSKHKILGRHIANARTMLIEPSDCRIQHINVPVSQGARLYF